MINTAKELISHFNHSNINPDLIEHIRRFDEKKFKVGDRVQTKNGFVGTVETENGSDILVTIDSYDRCCWKKVEDLTKVEPKKKIDSLSSSPSTVLFSESIAKINEIIDHLNSKE